MISRGIMDEARIRDAGAGDLGIIDLGDIAANAPTSTFAKVPLIAELIPATNSVPAPYYTPMSNSVIRIASISRHLEPKMTSDTHKVAVLTVGLCFQLLKSLSC